MIGSPRLHHRSIGSTNVRAREMAVAGAPHGTTVTAAAQTEGRGRGDRTWTTAEGDALLMSVVVRPADPLLPLRAAVALTDVLASIDDVTVKWPNDVLVGGRKVAGILVEGRPQEGWAVLGMGVNVKSFPEELGDRATSLSAAGSGLSVGSLFTALCEALDARVTEPPESLLDAWRARDGLLGREVAWDGGSGEASGIDDSGALIVETPDGRVALDAGEVHLQT